MVREVTVPILPLTEDTFAPFGRLVASFETAIARLRIGTVVRNQMRVRRTAVIEWLSCHEDGEQVIVPAEPVPTLFVVAPPAPCPDPTGVRAFLSEGHIGVCLAQGVWHTFPIPVTAEHALYNNAQGSKWHDYTHEVHLPSEVGCLLKVSLEQALCWLQERKPFHGAASKAAS